MTKKLLVLVALLSFSFGAQAQTIETLQSKISEILETKDATVGVAVFAGHSDESISINGNKRLPMQSVFKYHIAVAILDQVDKGNLSLSDKLEVTKKDLDNELWSPIRKKYPEGVSLTLAEILQFTVAVSDNVGCDLLIRILGGPKVIEDYFHRNGISDIAIKYNEVSQQAVWDRQYENWTTANAAATSLKVFYENQNKLLSDESYRFLWETMKSSQTGQTTIRGNLPTGTVVAHKTGNSGKNEAGLIAAQNDIGIVFLPDGSHFYLSVLVSDSNEKSAVNKKIIADIAELAWDYFEEH